ncbi:hypothetical protein SISNIDRAFT_14602 [Sistotremastrum niveocremeum HHB9708]|uniref:precorrin-2 dehydrogenase n=1 Tax=Sistotremastrum niveocremeum HHB9708 TaxID=1314777 RepID=A0A165AKV8_9AGAM|nr:hypothetical protein SISNIDRAFT_14602 [Sistotremastrum niveocremeum HHB9708]
MRVKGKSVCWPKLRFVAVGIATLVCYMTTPTKPVTSGSLLIAWQLRDKNVLIVGGGEVAAGRLEIVLGADARVTLIAPSEDLHKTIREIVDTNDRVTYHDRLFEGPEDLVGVDMALTAIDDVEESRRICEMARTRHIPINYPGVYRWQWTQNSTSYSQEDRERPPRRRRADRPQRWPPPSQTSQTCPRRWRHAGEEKDGMDDQGFNSVVARGARRSRRPHDGEAAR